MRDERARPWKVAGPQGGDIGGFEFAPAPVGPVGSAFPGVGIIGEEASQACSKALSRHAAAGKEFVEARHAHLPVQRDR